MNNLEEKISNTVKYSSKQWLPIYGVFQVVYDSSKGRPNIADDNNTITRMFGWIVYQSFWITAAVYYLNNQ